MLRLSNETLPFITKTGSVEVPNYNRDELKEGVYHLGVGNFSRVHFIKALHDLMQMGTHYEYGVVGVSLRHPDIPEILNAQDSLYTMVENPGADNKVTVVGTMLRNLYAPENPKAVVDGMASPDTRIISMAMTQNGYYIDLSTKAFLVNDPDIQHDLTSDKPKTAIGMIAHAFKKRMDAGIPGFTVLSCDNIIHNGDFTKKAVMGFIAAWHPELLEQAEKNMTFPNAMVDRIAAKTTPQHVDLVEKLIGLRDAKPVPTEPNPMVPWVLDKTPFIGGRPAFELVGARFVDDVTPYEKMKLRLLNVSHLGIACLGDLKGYVGINETMADKDFQEFMQVLMDRETGPTVPFIQGINMEAYKLDLVKRFVNPNLDDTTQRVATDAPLQVALDTIRDRLKENDPERQKIDLLALIVASWLKRTRGGENEKGGEIVVNHPLKNELAARGAEGLANGSDPLPQMEIDSLFHELASDDRLVAPVAKYLQLLDTQGVTETMDIMMLQLSLHKEKTLPKLEAPLERKPVTVVGPWHDAAHSTPRPSEWEQESQQQQAEGPSNERPTGPKKVIIGRTFDLNS